MTFRELEILEENEFRKKTKIKISEVQIGERFRSDLGDLSSLKQSIEQLGLLQPIGININKELVYGRRRFEACKELGWSEIPFVLVEFDTSLEKIAELKENLERADLTWQDKVKAIAELDRLYRDIYGNSPPGRRWDNPSNSEGLTGWSLERTANSLNMALSCVSEAVTLADAIDKYPRVANASTKFGALSHLKELSEVERRGKMEFPEIKNFIFGDCEYEIHKLIDDSIRCVLTDPPYGTEYVTGRRDKSSVLVKPMASDNIPELTRLLHSVLSQIKPKMKKDAALYLFTNWQGYPYVFHIVQKYFEIRNLLVWVKSNWMSGNLDYQYSPRHEFIIYATKGKPTLFGGRQNDVLNFDIVTPQERLHPVQKPVPLLQYLIERSTIKNELVCDPFAGVGSTAVAAIESNRNWVCIEKDKEYYEKALVWVATRRNLQ